MTDNNDIVLMPEELVLSEELVTLLVKGFNFGPKEAEKEPFALVQVSGRVNHSSDKKTLSFALKADGVMYLIDGLINVLSTMSELKKQAENDD